MGVPLSGAILPLRGTRREVSHPDGWGLRRRGPAGRCAGVNTGVPGRERHRSLEGSRNCIFTATGRWSACLDLPAMKASEVYAARGAARRCADLEVGPVFPVGAPWPARDQAGSRFL